MAVAERDVLSPVPPAFMEAFTAFVRTLLAIKPVRRIDTAQDLGHAHWWLFVDDDADEILDQIYGAEFQLRRAIGAVALDVWIIPLSDSVDLSTLPRADTLFER